MKCDGMFLNYHSHAKLNIQKQYICNLNLFAFDHVLNLWKLNKGQLKMENFMCFYAFI